MRNAAHNPKTWINQLWKDEWFKQAVNRRWEELVDEGIADSIQNYITETKQLLNASQQKNFQRWNVLNSRVYLEFALFPTYKEYVDFLQDYIAERVDYLSSDMVILPTPPFVAKNFYYTISNGNTGSLLDIDEDNTSFLTLWEPIDDKQSQQWKIISEGNEIYHFENRLTGKVIEGNGIDKALMAQEHDSLESAQKWKILPVGTNDTYGIVNKKSGYAIDNANGNVANGAMVIAYTNRISSNENQQWVFTKIEPIEEPSAKNSIAAKFDVTVYPNPFKNKLFIQTNQAILKKLKITIYDLNGEIKLALLNQNRMIDLSDLQPGIYILKLQDQNLSKVFRIIKM